MTRASHWSNMISLDCTELLLECARETDPHPADQTEDVTRQLSMSSAEFSSPTMY